jgi:predicted metal-binding protein
MDENELIRKALDIGFVAAEIVNTEEIEFSFQFRKYCRDNLCGQYGANYSCPPDCGTPEEMKEKAGRYKRALVLQSSWKINDFSDKEKIDSAKKWHNGQMLRLVKAIREEGGGCLMAGASYCNLCNPCKKTTSAPCSYPELSFFCLSAYCINVKLLAELCSMDYAYRDGTLSFFGCIFFEK